MSAILSLPDVREEDRARVGGKAYAVSRSETVRPAGSMPWHVRRSSSSLRRRM